MCICVGTVAINGGNGRCQSTVGVRRVEEAQKAAIAARETADTAQRAAEAAADAAMFAAIDAAASKFAPMRKGLKKSRHKGDLADFASEITSIGSWKAGKVIGTEDDSSMIEKHADGSQAAVIERLASPDKEHDLETPAQASTLEGWAKTQTDLDPFNGNGAKSAYSDAYTQGWPTGGAGQLTAIDRAAGAIGVQEARAGKWKMLQAQEYFGAASDDDESKRSRPVVSTTAANVGILRQHSHLRPVLQGLHNFRSKVAGLMEARRNRHPMPSSTNHRPRTSVHSSVVKGGQWVRRGTRRQTWRKRRQ